MMLRFLLAAVFLFAGLLKLSDPLALADGIAAFQFFPVSWINPLALGVPFFEVFTGLALFCRPTRGAGALAATGLSFCFLVLYAFAMARGLEIHCACFGKWEFLQATTGTGLVRALFLLAASLWVWRREHRAVRPGA